MHKKSIEYDQSGFTIMELLVVTGILVAVSGIIGGILFSTLRGSETTRSTTQIAQNGNYAITTFSEIIKQSRQVVNVYEDEPIEDFQDCTDNPTGTNIVLRMPDNNYVSLTCNYNDEQKLASVSAERTYFLVDEELITAQNSCRISCHQSSAFVPPRVEIQFELGKESSSGELVDNSAKLFQTQINVRNFNTQ